MDDLLIVLTGWFLLGIVSAAWIYHDQKKGPGVSGPWVAIGFFLSLVGLVAYEAVGRKQAVAQAYAPGDEYSKPDYKFEGEKEKVAEPPKPPVEVKLKKKEEKVEQLEGCPRCPKCGAAISLYDFKCWDCGAQLRAE